LRESVVTDGFNRVKHGQAATAEQARPVAEALAAWQPVNVMPASILVGYYTVAPEGFRVDPHASLAMK